MEEVSRNILKHMVRSKSLQHHIVIIYDTEIMIPEADDQSKLEELRKNMHKLYSKKLDEHTPTEFALAVYYSDVINCRKMYIFLLEQKVIWMYFPKRCMEF